MMSKTSVMTSKSVKRHPDMMYESCLTRPCKTVFPSPGRIHGNSGRVCKKCLTYRQFVDSCISFVSLFMLFGQSSSCLLALDTLRNYLLKQIFFSLSSLRRVYCTKMLFDLYIYNRWNVHVIVRMRNSLKIYNAFIKVNVCT